MLLRQFTGSIVGHSPIVVLACGIARSVHDALAVGGKIDFVYGVDDASGLSSDHRRAPNERLFSPPRATGNRRTRVIPAMFPSEHWSVIAEGTAGSSGA